jgi:hypothetical protein
MDADGFIPTEGHAAQPAVLKHGIAGASPHHWRGGGFKEAGTASLICKKCHSLLVALCFAELGRTGAPQKSGLANTDQAGCWINGRPSSAGSQGKSAEDTKKPRAHGETPRHYYSA